MVYFKKAINVFCRRNLNNSQTRIENVLNRFSPYINFSSYTHVIDQCQTTTHFHDCYTDKLFIVVHLFNPKCNIFLFVMIAYLVSCYHKTCFLLPILPFLLLIYYHIILHSFSNFSYSFSSDYHHIVVVVAVFFIVSFYSPSLSSSSCSSLSSSSLSSSSSSS